MVVDDDTGQLYIIDPVLYFDAPPARVTTEGERAVDAADTMQVVQRLRARGVNTIRVAEIMGRPSATGAQYTPRLVAVALDDAAFNSLKGVVTVVHEGAHALYAQLQRVVSREGRDVAGDATGRARAVARDRAQAGLR